MVVRPAITGMLGLLLVGGLTILAVPANLAAGEPATDATGADPLWSRQELQQLLKEMTCYVVEHHMRRDDCPMRGKVYEFYLPAKDLAGYGRGWDTMHDGGFFGNACILAYRATGDPYYLEVVRDWIMPFYLKVLNHSDELFPDRDRAFTDGQPLPEEKWIVDKGFIPYCWDDGTSVHFHFYARGWKLLDHYPKQFGFTWTGSPPTKPGEIAGYCHGTSNHMALNIFHMLANYWLLTRDPATAEALRNLRESRQRWLGHAPLMVVIGDAAANGDPQTAYQQAAGYDLAPWPPRSPLFAAFVQKQKTMLPAFLDDPQGKYTATVVAKRVGPGIAKQTAQTTLDSIRLGDMWYGERRRPRGLSIADANRPDRQVWIVDGQFQQHAGDDPAVLVGSRMGTQTLFMAAVSLQLLDAFPDSWRGYFADQRTNGDVDLGIWDEPPLETVRARLKEELDEGLRFWQDQFHTIGFLRPDWPIGGVKPDEYYLGDQLSETGGYAHVIAAAAEYLLLMDGKRDWEVAWSITVEP